MQQQQHNELSDASSQHITGRRDSQQEQQQQEIDSPSKDSNFMMNDGPEKPKQLTNKCYTYYRLVYVALMIFIGVFSLACSIVATIGIRQLDVSMGSFTSNMKTYPVINMRIAPGTPSNVPGVALAAPAECNSDEESLYYYPWPGLLSGCNCINAWAQGLQESNLAATMYVGSCTPAMTTAGCIGVSPLPAQSLIYFDDNGQPLLLCVQRLDGYQYYNSAPQSAPISCGDLTQCGDIIFMLALSFGFGVIETCNLLHKPVPFLSGQTDENQPRIVRLKRIFNVAPKLFQLPFNIILFVGSSIISNFLHSLAQAAPSDAITNAQLKTLSNQVFNKVHLWNLLIFVAMLVGIVADCFRGGGYLAWLRTNKLTENLRKIVPTTFLHALDESDKDDQKQQQQQQQQQNQSHSQNTSNLNNGDSGNISDSKRKMLVNGQALQPIKQQIVPRRIVFDDSEAFASVDAVPPRDLSQVENTQYQRDDLSAMLHQNETTTVGRAGLAEQDIEDEIVQI